MKPKSKILSSQLVLAIGPLVVIAAVVLWPVGQGIRTASAQAEGGLRAGIDYGRKTLMLALNAAVSQMDQVTQRNAAGAEESAAAAAELGAQPRQSKAWSMSW